MEDRIILREFERLAGMAGIRIRHTNEHLSGVCTIKGKQVIFIDNALDERQKINIFTSSFRSIDLDGVFVVPVIRRLLGGDEYGDW